MLFFQMRVMPLPIFCAKRKWKSFKWGKSTSCDFVAHSATLWPKKLAPLSFFAVRLERLTCGKSTLFATKAVYNCFTQLYMHLKIACRSFKWCPLSLYFCSVTGSIIYSYITFREKEPRAQGATSSSSNKQQLSTVWETGWPKEELSWSLTGQHNLPQEFLHCVWNFERY